jgi:hypothetical protein
MPLGARHVAAFSAMAERDLRSACGYWLSVLGQTHHQSGTVLGAAWAHTADTLQCSHPPLDVQRRVGEAFALRSFDWAVHGPKDLIPPGSPLTGREDVPMLRGRLQIETCRGSAWPKGHRIRYC